MMITVISVLVIVLILAAAITYIVKEKRRGTRCIGCPAAGTCEKHKGKHEHMHETSARGCGCHGGQN